jgi:hypothetical protein
LHGASDAQRLREHGARRVSTWRASAAGPQTGTWYRSWPAAFLEPIAEIGDDLLVRSPEETGDQTWVTDGIGSLSWSVSSQSVLSLSVIHWIAAA